MTGSSRMRLPAAWTIAALPTLAMASEPPCTEKIPSNGCVRLDGDLTGPIKNRNVTRHLAEQDEPRLRDAAAAIVDDEVVGAPQPERPGREIELPLEAGQGQREIPGLFLTEVVAHLDGERQHPDQRSRRIVVHQLGIAPAPELEEIKMRSCAMAGPINPSAMTKALKSATATSPPAPASMRLRVIMDRLLGLRFGVDRPPRTALI